MTSQHTIHHSKGKWEKASPERRTISKLQRQINNWKKKYQKILLSNQIRLNQVRLFSEASNKLVKDGIVEKDYFSKYMPSRSEIIKQIEEKKNSTT